MANCKKATRGAMGHLMKHYERSKDENGEYIKFGNQQIDVTRTHLNYNLAPEHDQLDFIHERLKEVYVLKRKDVNVMCSWVVTVPKELPEEYHKLFFERAYDFLRKRYSPDEKNIISSYVHMDEVTPHMHFAFIPVVYDEKKGREKVSAKEVVDRTDLSAFHKDFQNTMDEFVKEYGNIFQCNVLNGVTAGGNKSIEEFKAEKAADYREKLVKEIGSMENRLHTLDVTAGSSETLAKEFVNNPNVKPVFDEYKSKKRENIVSNRKAREKQRASVKEALARNRKELSGRQQPKKQREHDLESER